ncbi:TPA: hypothetical protein AB5H45_003596 [Vibrio mimicus]|nr:hypothetical protein [Vibrio cholerae]EGR0845032.1 hypothetical protein [Vibrio cholerae]EGR0862465.1 hypothetical protein [Vibrio cholerae]
MDINGLNNLRKLRKHLKTEPSSLISEIIEKLTIVHDEVYEREQREVEEKALQEEILAAQRKAILESGVDIASLMEALAQDVQQRKVRKPRSKPSETPVEQPSQTPNDNAKQE